MREKIREGALAVLAFSVLVGLIYLIGIGQVAMDFQRAEHKAAMAKIEALAECPKEP